MNKPAPNPQPKNYITPKGMAKLQEELHQYHIILWDLMIKEKL